MSRPAGITALVFDFDGLILDTETPELQSWEEEYRRHGVVLDRQAWIRCIGTGPDGLLGEAFDPYASLEAALGRAVDREAVRTRRRRRHLELVDAQPICAGVEAWLADAAELGCRLAVASSSTTDWVAGHLERRGLASLFDCIVGRDMVGDVAKPAPDVYEHALAALGAEPSDAIAIEDSPNGLRAARRAGLFCVAVPNPVTRELVFDDADLILGSLEELALTDLLSRAGARAATVPGP